MKDIVNDMHLLIHLRIRRIYHMNNNVRILRFF